MGVPPVQMHGVPCSEGFTLVFMLCSYHLEIPNFEHGVTHFHFFSGTTNHVVGPVVTSNSPPQNINYCDFNIWL